MEQKDGLRGKKTSLHPVFTCQWMCATISAALLPNTLFLWLWLTGVLELLIISQPQQMAECGYDKPTIQQAAIQPEKLPCCPHLPCIWWHQQCLFHGSCYTSASANPGLCCCPNWSPNPEFGPGVECFSLLFYPMYPWKPLSAYSKHTAPSI